MNDDVRISEAARQLRVSPQYLRLLEWEGKIPPARRDYSGRVYSRFDIALLKGIGVGLRPRQLRRAEEVLEAAR
jgi:DNA-binding transcriptional MerR regulator